MAHKKAEFFRPCPPGRAFRGAPCARSDSAGVLRWIVAGIDEGPRTSRYEHATRAWLRHPHLNRTEILLSTLDRSLRLHISNVAEDELELCFEILLASVAAGGDSREVFAHVANVELGRKLQQVLGVDSILDPSIGHAERA
jgi:hypothetical protein